MRPGGFGLRIPHAVPMSGDKSGAKESTLSSNI